MGVERISTESVQSSAQSSSTTITVPADCTLVVVMAVGFGGIGWMGANPISINSVNLTTQEKTDSQDTNGQVWIGYLANPATGSRTLAWSWNNAPSEGVQYLVVYLRGASTSNPIRSSGQQTAADTDVTGLTAELNELMLGCVYSYTSITSVTDNSQTELLKGGPYNTAYYGFAEKQAGTGFYYTGGSYQTCAGIVVRSAEVLRYVDPDADAGGNGTVQTLTGSNCAYVSLNAWEAARQRDLTSSGEIERVTCSSNLDAGGGSADTTKCIVGGWTTNATCYIQIEASSGSRARTEWSNDKYRLVRQGVGDSDGIDVQSDILYIRVVGLQIECNTSSLEAPGRDAIAIAFLPAPGTNGADIRVGGCHIRITGTLPYTMTGMACGIYGAPSTVGAVPVPNFYIWNNIISWEATGTWSSAYHDGIQVEHRTHNAYIYNNTIRGAWTDGVGGDSISSERYHYLKNNLFSGVTNPTVGDHSNTRCDYNATNQSDLGYTAGSNDRVSQTFTFVSSTDYALASTDGGARNYGMTDPGSGLFTDDINGDTRSAPWDIGADEYVASGTLYTRVIADNMAVY